MKMKRMNHVCMAMMAVAAFALSLFSCTGGQKGYEIKGEISGVEDGTIYLKRYEDKSFSDLDSAVITNGKFHFKGFTPEVIACGLTTVKNSKYPLLFFLDNERTTVKLDEQNKHIVVDGSPVNALYFTSLPLVDDDNYRIDSLIAANPASAVGSYLLMRNFAWRLSLEELQKTRSLFDASLDGTLYVNQVDSLIDRLQHLQVGSVAPDFTLPDVNDNPVSLSSFRGKYVWVDFWASWCPDCRRENPLLVKAYQRFKDKNFTVFGVSLDRQKDAWLNAIEKDNLTWTHVVDLHSWQADVAALYAIRWVPTGYLLNPDGVIIASSTTAKDLVDKLEEVLGR